MKVKSKSIFLLGVVLFSAFTVGGVIFYRLVPRNETTINVTALWDEPGSELSNYNRTSGVPTFVEVYSYSSSDRINHIRGVMKLVAEISLAHVGGDEYTGAGILRLPPNLRYIVTLPACERADNDLSEYNSAAVDVHTPVNNLTVHFWWDITLYILEENMVAMKPAIYLYNTAITGKFSSPTFTESVSVVMPTGLAIKTIPEVPLSSTISWNNCEVYPGSRIQYNGTFYPYLFYEAEIKYINPIVLNHGWVIRNSGEGRWAVNGDAIPNLHVFFRESLARIGLYEREIAEFVGYWLDEMGIFNETGTYTLRHIPVEMVDKIFHLQTLHSYSTTRVFFTFNHSPDVNAEVRLLPPVSFSTNAGGDFVLHEWGILF